MSPSLSRSSVAILWFVTAGLVACGGGDGPTDPPATVTIAITPASATLDGGGTQLFTATVTNGSTNDVTWTSSGGTLTGTGNSRTFTAPTTGGPFTVTATSVADASKSASATVTLRAVTVAVSPATVTVAAGGTQEFSATVANTSNGAVTWTTSAGTIAASGSTATLTAPGTGGTVTVTATSVADPTKSGTATVTVTAATVAIAAPSTTTPFRGEPVSLTASVTGATVTTVQWSATCGAVTGTGLTVTWTAPNAGGDCVVTAASTLDPTRTATVTMRVRPDMRVAATDDADDGACTWSHCSLREAINAANADPDVDSIRLVAASGASTSRFGMPARSMANGTIVTLTSPLPAITTSVHIIGPGADLLTIDANGTAAARRHFAIQGAVTGSVRGLTLINGRGAAAAGSIFIGDGADIKVQNVTMSGNETVDGEGGAMMVMGENTKAELTNVVMTNNRANGASKPGGALSITSGAQVSMTGGSITNNTVSDGWGGGVRTLNATLAMTNVQVTGNRTLANAGGGGGILAQGNTATLQLTNVTVSNNTTVASAGALRLLDVDEVTITNSTFSNNTAMQAGAIEAVRVAQLTITGTTISGNTTTNGAGGALFAEAGAITFTNVTIRENVTGGQFAGGGIFANNASITMTGGSMQQNQASGRGGGLAVWGTGTAVIEGTSITGNSALLGGGLQAQGNGSFQLTNVTLSENTAVNGGGGIAVIENSALTMTGGQINANFAGANGSGGGILKTSVNPVSLTGTRVFNNTAALQSGGLHLTGGGAVTLSRVTVSNNTANTGGGGSTLGNATVSIENSTFNNNTTSQVASVGGGVFSSSTATTTIRNSTFSANSGGIGGGVGATGAISVVNATFVGNTAQTFGGGIGVNVNGVMQLRNSLLSANTVAAANGNCGLGGAGVITSQGNNLSDHACASLTGPNDKNSTAAGVNATLGNNGGSTFTHALLAGSAAIDAGHAASCPTTDQRGAPRIGTCDIGAFEFGATAPAGAAFGSTRSAIGSSARRAVSSVRMSEPAASGRGGAIPATIMR